MPFDEPDSDDPFELVGMEVPAAGPDAVREMAVCFAEEFARMGWESGQILALFEDPAYGSAHAAYVAVGADGMREIVEEAVRPWRAGRAAARAAAGPGPENARSEP